MRFGLRVVPVLAAVLGLSACDEDWNFGNSERFHEDFHFSHPLTAGGRITLDTFNGSVEISGWDKDTVEISGTKYANTESRLHEIRVDVTPSPGLVDFLAAIHAAHFQRRSFHEWHRRIAFFRSNLAIARSSRWPSQSSVTPPAWTGDSHQPPGSWIAK